MEDVRHMTQRIARDLHLEPPRLECSPSNVRLTQKTQVMLQHVFVHLVRNALDHGIERSPDRLKAQKPAKGTIRIGFDHQGTELLMSIEDDGRGLALRKIQAQALAKGQISADEKDAQTIANLIFREGVSTAEQLTEISGRGIGMASIKRFLENNGASISIVLNQPWHGQDYLPFRFVIRLPADAFIDELPDAALDISPVSA
jgi:chemotaxis protein histidine kinase CheA